MKKQMTVCEPQISNALLTNPGIGFIAAPALMAAEARPILDNRGNPVSPYRFAPDSKTWNHPDSGVYFCSSRWKEIEISDGVYAWNDFDEKLEAAAAMGCTAVVRISPYALSEQEDIPDWLRKRWPAEPEFPFWRIDPNTTDYAQLWARLIREFARRYDGHPVISSVDMAIVGAWGEGGGTELMDYDAMEAIIRAYIDGFRHTPLQALLHDPRSLECIRNCRAKVGFRVDCLGDMGGFHGDRWSHMLDFYPENIENFEMADAWQDAPVVFEACWHMNDWYLQGWDIDYIIDESLKWHISSYNSKGTTVPEEWRPSVERWVRRMGYRFELHQFCWESDPTAGGFWRVELLVLNTGVAPCYHNYAPVIRLCGPNCTVDLPLDEDIRTWMPDEEHFVQQALRIPENLDVGEYEVRIGFPTGLPQRPALMLAIENAQVDGFYKMGCVHIARGEEKGTENEGTVI